MNNKLKLAALGVALITMTIGGCKKKENPENELFLNFKKDAGYTNKDMTLAKGTTFKVGVKGEAMESKDPIIKFNISESVNGAAAATLFSQDVETQNYDHDQDFTVLDTIHGNTHKYTFTVFNRDGFSVQKALTITVQ